MLNYDDLIGTPYVIGGRGPEAYDCYGLLMELYKRQGIALADFRSTEEQSRIASIMVVGVQNWVEVLQQPNVAVLFRVGRFISHVGYVIDDLSMIHCWKSSAGVVVERLDCWQQRIVGYYKHANQ